MRIINNTNITLSTEAQQVIKNSAAHYGVENVVIAKHANDGGNDTLFYVFDENDNLLFSLDTEGCVTF